LSEWQERMYPLLPIFAQNLVCDLHGYSQYKLRYGGEFQELLDWLEETEWWSDEEIQEYQNIQLRKLVQHAYATVPYYQRVFDELKLKPDDIQSTAHLQKLPILTKEDVHKYMGDMISSEFKPNELVFVHTSGTTGKSLQFYMEPRAFQFRWAVWWRHRKWFGIEFDSPYASFTGLSAVPLQQTAPPFWRENRPMHQTIFTMHHIVPEKIDAIVARLNRYGFDYYHGYPSIIYNLAVLIQEHNQEITRPPKIIFTGAENLYEDQRQAMREVIKCPVTDHYGFSEGCGNASRCSEDLYHEDFEYGILECVNPELLGDGSIRGNIIATGFGSYAMPFIRYDVGDVGTWVTTNCKCGRRSKTLIRVEGRTEDYIITPEGRKIMRFDYIFKDTHSIKEAQVVQRELGSLCLRVVRRSSYSISDEEFLREEINRRVSAKIKVKFEYVEEIGRETSGKFQAVKSEIREVKTA